MTFEIALVLVLVVATAVLFMTEWLPVDKVALVCVVILVTRARRALAFRAGAVLVAFIGLTMLLTQPLSNAAAELVVLPVAVSTAAEIGIEPRSLAILVTLSASLSFLSPLELLVSWSLARGDIDFATSSRSVYLCPGSLPSPCWCWCRLSGRCEASWRLWRTIETYGENPRSARRPPRL